MVTGTSFEEIVKTAEKYLRINTLFYFVPTVIAILRNAMQGIGDLITPIFSSLIELVGKVMIAFFLAPKIHYMGIIIAEPIVWVLMVIPLIIMIIRNPIFKEELKR